MVTQWSQKAGDSKRFQGAHLIRADSEAPLAGLRAELQKLLDFEWDQQRAIVEKLRAIYPHSIGALHSAEFHDRIREFNCFAFAFQVYRWSRFFDLRKASPGVVFTETFVAAMLADLHEVTPSEAVEGDVVIYSTETIVHAGIVHGQGVVRSKWGESYIWRHGTFEVPAEYGWEVHYFAALPLEVMVDRYRFHAERQMDAYYAKLDELSRHKN